MKNLFWFITHSIRYVGFKTFVKGFIPAYKKWNTLMKENDK